MLRRDIHSSGNYSCLIVYQQSVQRPSSENSKSTVQNIGFQHDARVEPTPGRDTPPVFRTMCYGENNAVHSATFINSQFKTLWGIASESMAHYDGFKPDVKQHREFVLRPRLGSTDISPCPA